MAGDAVDGAGAGRRAGGRLRGALAAVVTPLKDGGEALDEDAFGPVVDFLVAGGIDGILAAGTTGEGVLLERWERERAFELYAEAGRGRLPVIAHCGAQSTRETVALAESAAGAGCAAVAVIGPPYYAFDRVALLAHFAAAAAACAPLPFYLYEFQARSGYAVPLEVIDELRAQAENFVGLKVSDTPYERFAAYLVEGLDVFVGNEPLIPRALTAGAVGAVSGMAGAFPERVADLVRDPSPEGGEAMRELREALSRAALQSALKHVMGRRGVPVRADVRAPLRALTRDEAHELDGLLDELTGSRAAV